MPIKTDAVQTSWVTTDPIVGFDISTLQDGQIHLLNDKKQPIGLSYPSSTVAAWELDRKSSKLYIHRYVNVERIVETSKGSFYFVQNNLFKPSFDSHISSKPNLGKAGKRSTIIVHDLVLDVYVEFMSKNSLGLFLWGKSKTGGGTFDRYLHNGVVFKNRLSMYFKDTAPSNITIISTTQYFDMIKTDRLSSIL